eukprot:g2227.t1
MADQNQNEEESFSPPATDSKDVNTRRSRKAHRRRAWERLNGSGILSGIIMHSPIRSPKSSPKFHTPAFLDGGSGKDSSEKSKSRDQNHDNQTAGLSLSKKSDTKKKIATTETKIPWRDYLIYFILGMQLGGFIVLKVYSFLLKSQERDRDQNVGGGDTINENVIAGVPNAGAINDLQEASGALLDAISVIENVLGKDFS